MATCAVTGTIMDLGGNALQSFTVQAQVLNPVLSGNTLITPGYAEAQTDSSGNFTITLQQSCTVLFRVQYPVLDSDPALYMTYVGTIPAQTSASFSAVVTQEP